MNAEIKRNLRDRWISSLFEIAHSEFQNRLWINANYKNSVGDYNECVCGYFDDLDLENGYSDFISNGIISESEYKIVTELHSEFKKYTERTEKRNLSDKNILKDVEWINVTNIGFKTWTELKKKTESIRDKQLMNELENKYLKGKTPQQRIYFMAGERLPSGFLLRIQLWFRCTGKCFETATSHMQTVVCLTKKKIKDEQNTDRT